MWSFISGIFSLFIGQYHPVLITILLLQVLQLGSVILSALFFIFKIFLIIWDSIWILRWIFFFLCKKCHWYFDTDCFESIESFGQYWCVNNIKSSNPWIWMRCPSICLCLLNCFLSILFFWCYYKGNYICNLLSDCLLIGNRYAIVCAGFVPSYFAEWVYSNNFCVWNYIGFSLYKIMLSVNRDNVIFFFSNLYAFNLFSLD